MRARHIWVVAALVGALAGCGSDEEAAPAPSATVDAAEVAYLKALKAIDPALAEKRSAVSDGENICLDLKQGKTSAQVAKNAAARFEVDAAAGVQIVAATKASLCSAG